MGRVVRIRWRRGFRQAFPAACRPSLDCSGQHFPWRRKNLIGIRREAPEALREATNAPPNPRGTGKYPHHF